MSKNTHRKELEIVKEICRPSGYSTQLYTYEGVYHVRINSPLGITMQPGEFETMEEALVYFDTLATTLSDNFYS